MEIFIKIATAFLVGGAICFAVQIVIDKTALTPARILVFLVVGGVLLGAVGLYDKIYSFAGCGISVSLIGFGGNIAKTVRESVLSSGLSGIITAGCSGRWVPMRDLIPSENLIRRHQWLNF